MQSKVLRVPYEKLYIHFHKLFNDPNASNILPSAFDVNYQNDVLNMPFHIHEISESIKLLKINKASGEDELINEYFKNATVDMIPTISHLFNIILNSGIIPSEWTKGIIKPLYKNKGNADEPENYRGITLLRAFGKLFTATIKRRLETYLQNENIIGEEQAGFRKGYSTTDHIFVLTSLIDIYLSKSKKLFALFVDYKTAFDRISRSILWLKLVNNGINGKKFRIYNHYKEAKSCIEYNGKLSPFFPCNIGVRQGENLSPLLYAIYVNDFSSHLGTTIKGLPYIMKLASNIAGDYMELYRKLFILLYADDTVILAESANDMQMALHSLKDYCSQNELTLNTCKSKVMVFSKGKNTKCSKFILWQ